MIRGTLENLKAAAAGEHYEQTQMYPAFAEAARDEGFPEVAGVFANIAVAERYHERRYLGLAENIEKDRTFKRPDKTTWRCRNCGYIHEGKEAPEQCPACAHPRSFFEILCQSW
jgi:rubrerythrin